jgi:hypothetical protein
MFLLFQIDDLPDEGYVWASKIDNFIQVGRLGVELGSRIYGESTVGFLQFLLASIPRALGLTIEQSIYIPLWISLTVSQVVLYKIVEKYTNSKYFALLIIALVYAIPAIGYNFALGFDNILAYTFLIYWLYFELNTSKAMRNSARILLVIIFPIIRLDFAIVSLGIVGLHFIENKMFSRKTILREVKTNLPFYLISFLSILIWLSYKIWAFGELVPAMAIYKGFHIGGHLFYSGLTYFFNSLSIKSIAIPLLFTIIFTIRIPLWSNQLIENFPKILDSFKKKNTQVLRLLLLNLVYFAVSTILVILAGGDYFGTSLMRYQFPFIILICLLLFLLLQDFLKTMDKFFVDKSLRLIKLWGIEKKLVLFSSIITLGFLFGPINTNFLINDLKQVERNGRVSCEAAAGFAIKKALPYVDIISTPEVNGIAYHSETKLIDLIGLVDPSFKTTEFIGDSLHKFRVEQSDQEIFQTDLLWLHPGAECAISREQLTSASNYGERLNGLINAHPGNFRVIDFSRYKNQGFIPQVLEYNFNSAGIKMYGTAFMFIRPN